MVSIHMSYMSPMVLCNFMQPFIKTSHDSVFFEPPGGTVQYVGPALYDSHFTVGKLKFGEEGGLS